MQKNLKDEKRLDDTTCLKAFESSLADLDFGCTDAQSELTLAEQKLLDAAQRGLPCVLASVRPDGPAPDNQVRAAFLAFLAQGGGGGGRSGEKRLELHGAVVEGEVDLENAEVTRPIWLRHCLIPGLLNGRNGRFKELGFEDTKIGGIDLKFARVDGGVFMRRGFHALGEVALTGASVAGALNCNGGRFENPGGAALSCGSARITGDVQLSDGFFAYGETRFAGAELGDLLECRGGSFINPGGTALNCERAKIAGHVWLNRGFSAEGAVRLHSVAIGGQVVCEGSFNNSGGMAINGTRAQIQGDVFFLNGCTVVGETRFRGVAVGGSFICSGGSFSNPQPKPAGEDGVVILADALFLSGAKIQGGLLLTGIYSSHGKQPEFIGSVDLTHAQAGSFADHPESWPKEDVKTPAGDARGALALDGFTYDQFANGAPTDAETRKRWLLRQQPSHMGREFRPQPFEQLVKALRAMGHDEHARQIAMFKQSLLLPHRISRAPWWSRPFVWLVGQLWGGLVGYGHRPHRLVVTLLLLWLACAGGYQLAANAGHMSPADPQVWTNTDLVHACKENWATCPEISNALAFNAMVYSADVLLPVVDLRQRAAWTPRPGWARALAWTENALGSLGVVLLGAILGGLIKRD